MRMDTRIHFYKLFAKRMGLLAWVTGILIALCMPFTYFVLTMRDEQKQAVTASEQMAWRLRDTVKENPYLWKLNAPKLTKILADYENQGIAEVKVYDTAGKLIDTETFTKPPLLEITGRSAVIYNNNVYGFVEVAWDSKGLVTSTLILLTAFSSLAFLVGVVLFRYPARIVAKSEREVTEAFKRLNHMSYHDPLTGLPNRIQLNDRLSQALKQSGRNRQKVAVLFLDLDRFKLINDTLGHGNGDILLQAVAKRLITCMRDGDTVARLGGDEFIVLLPVVYEGHDAAKVAQRIIEALAQPFELDGHELVVTTSIGISLYPADGDNIETLVKNADTAMYRAKEQGNSIYRFYSSAMNAAALERLTLENGLRKALKREELVIHYQPIIDLYTGDIIGMEALVRWQHPELGLVSPSKFVPLAEETGLIIPLGEWVLRSACVQNKAWQNAGFPPMYVSVNLSQRQFQQRGLSEMVTRVLKESGLSPRHLQLEITESVAMYDEGQVINKLVNLKNLGVCLAVDDFGTGYSSLGSLKRFPINTIKIDKSFIHNIPTDRFDSAITTTVINMADSLQLSVIAEGVESEEQLAFLLARGCNAMQGYLFCKPLPAEDFESMLSQRKRLRTEAIASGGR